MDSLEDPTIPSCLGEVCWSNAEVAPVSWGMSLQQFNDFVNACRMTSVWAAACEKGHVNLYDVVKSLVKPWTRNTGCSIALRMNPEKVLQAELMVSHSWQECMDQCSEALSNFCARQQVVKAAVILWFCAFAQYQPGDEPGDRGPTVSEQLALDPFGSVIRSLVAGGLGMVVVQTSMGDVYSRLWCVYEIAEAVASKAQVSMAYSQHALETRNGSFEEMLRARTSRASCREPSDEEMIRSKVEQSGGFNRLDSIIFEFRLKAFQEMLHELQESTREQLKSEIQNMTGYGVSNLDEQCLAAEGFQVEKKAGGVMGWMICMAPVMLIVGLIALPFIVLCAPCILLYRHRMAAKAELSVAKMDVFVDPEPGKDVMIGQAHTHSAKSRSSSKRDSPNERIGSPSGPPGPPTGSPRSPGGPPAPETPTAWGAARVDEEDGEDGKDDELMLQRLEMARKMAPQLFN